MVAGETPSTRLLSTSSWYNARAHLLHGKVVGALLGELAAHGVDEAPVVLDPALAAASLLLLLVLLLYLRGLAPNLTSTCEGTVLLSTKHWHVGLERGIVAEIVVAEGADVLENAAIVRKLGALEASALAELELDVFDAIGGVALEALGTYGALDEDLHPSSLSKSQSRVQLKRLVWFRRV